jgi:hypothetical protein
MVLSVTAAPVDPSSILTSAQGFLTYGPIGLAGLLIALSLIVLLLRTVDASRERIFKLVLYIGTFCFIAALIAQHFPPPPDAGIGANRGLGAGDFQKQHAILQNVMKGLTDSEPPLQQVTTMASDGDGCPGHRGIPHGADMASRSSGVLAFLQSAQGQLKAVSDSLP